VEWRRATQKRGGERQTPSVKGSTYYRSRIYKSKENAQEKSLPQRSRIAPKTIEARGVIVIKGRQPTEVREGRPLAQKKCIQLSGGV